MKAYRSMWVSSMWMTATPAHEAQEAIKPSLWRRWFARPEKVAS